MPQKELKRMKKIKLEITLPTTDIYEWLKKLQSRQSVLEKCWSCVNVVMYTWNYYRRLQISPHNQEEAKNVAKRRANAKKLVQRILPFSLHILEKWFICTAKNRNLVQSFYEVEKNADSQEETNLWYANILGTKVFISIYSNTDVTS